mmetsp:Transcript_37847/g.55737  ORF Transcript_37847/g.55737 Transcript_37847/m.55737 type:complete len:366 (-) Transcript_37847:80-1177(-)
MADFHALGDGDDDDTVIILQEATETIQRQTRTIYSKISLLQERPSASVDGQIKNAYRKGQDTISETKADIRGCERTPRVRECEAEFQRAVSKLKKVYEQYQTSGASQISQSDDHGGHATTYATGIHGDSQQSLQLVMDTEDVDELLERETREDALRLARDTAILRDTMMDARDLIEEGGEQLMDTDAVMEDAAQNTEAAVEELTKAREHQKASMKCKIIVAAVCGCIVVIAIIVIVIKFYAEAGTMTAQSAQPTTCETGDDTKCLYQCSVSGYSTSSKDGTMSLSPVSATVSLTGCETYSCPSGSATVSSTSASGQFTDGYGTTFTMSATNSAITMIQQTGANLDTQCSLSFKVTSGSVLGVGAS